MRRALVPVDGSDHALEGVRHVIKVVRDGQPLDVHLLNAQPPLTGDVMAFIPHSAVEDYHLEEAKRAMRGACGLLDRAGIPYSKHIVVGRAPRVIADWARELRCDLVVIGTRRFATITQLLLGSVSQEAIRLMDPSIAVTLVKADHETQHLKQKRIAT
jgi:nucleotide-binding universal stress UspA family protein